LNSILFPETFGVTIDSTVFEFVRHERLAWDAHCNGVHAYHARRSEYYRDMNALEKHYSPQEVAELWALSDSAIRRLFQDEPGVLKVGEPSQRLGRKLKRRYFTLRIPETPETLGAFGENLTTRGVLEADLNIGDQLRVGTALLQVTQPRMPCYKLQMRFTRDDMTRLFALSGRSGFYFSVIEEGEVKAGDSMELVEHMEHGVSVAEVYGLYFDRTIDPELLRRALQTPALTDESRSMLLRRLT